MERLFGRNVGKTLATVAGCVTIIPKTSRRFRFLILLPKKIVLAIVNIVLASISLASKTNFLMVMVDVLMLISSTIQILTFLAEWVIMLATIAVEGIRKLAPFL